MLKLKLWYNNQLNIIGNYYDVCIIRRSKYQCDNEHRNDMNNLEQKHNNIE